MEVEEFRDPVDVGIAGARGVVFEMDGVAVLFEEFFLFFRRRRRGWGVGLCHSVAFQRERLYNRHIGT